MFLYYNKPDLFLFFPVWVFTVLCQFWGLFNAASVWSDLFVCVQVRTVYNTIGTSEEFCNFELKIVPKTDDGKGLIWF